MGKILKMYKLLLNVYYSFKFWIVIFFYWSKLILRRNINYKIWIDFYK